MPAEDIYRFGYRWIVRGPIDIVWRYVSDARTFLDWFTVFKEVHADDPVGPIKVGSHTTMLVKALLPYTLDWDVTVARYEPPTLLETAIKVTLRGRFGMHGRITFSLEDQGDGTVLVWNEQQIAADKPLPRFLHPLAQAAFAFNHRWAMNQAQRPLQAIVAGASSAGR
jgi:Polyketide cyclase / dehydrase and lipid transport